MQFIESCLILDQLGGVSRLLVFERHRMQDAFDIASGLLTGGVLREFREWAGLRYQRVDEVASHGIGDAAQGAQRDAVGRLGAFEFFDCLPRRARSRPTVSIHSVGGVCAGCESLANLSDQQGFPLNASHSSVPALFVVFEELNLPQPLFGFCFRLVRPA
jgi:hypothetical protein